MTITTHDSTEKGQSLVEFAMSLVFLLTLLAGVADFGRAFFAYIIVRDAVQEGAVYGAIADKSDLNQFKTKVENRVKTAFVDPAAPGDIPVDIQTLAVNTSIVGSPCAGAGNAVRVTVDYTIPITTPFLGTIIGSQTLPMSTSIEDTILSPLCP